MALAALPVVFFYGLLSGEVLSMADLLQWWNLVYVLAFFFALLYALLNAIGLASSGAEVEADVDADVDVDVGADVDVDMDVDVGVEADVDVGADVDVDADVDVEADIDAAVEADVDADVDADVGADVDVEHDADVAAAHAEPSVFQEALSFFGIGKVPLSVIFMSFLMTFAVVGWAINTALGGMKGAVFFISCPAAVVCALGGTKLLAGLLGRYLKPVESAAVRRSSLEGSIGTASLPITERFGNALVRDSYGTQHKVVCRVRKGAEPISKGKPILLVRFVRTAGRGRRNRGYFIVEPYDVPGK